MDTSRKIRTVEELTKEIHRQQGGKEIAFTNGCFDIIHAGHVSYLEKAKADGRVLIVGVNSDQSVRRIKKDKLLVNKEDDRARILAALSCVDYVVIFNEETPIGLIEAIKPKILIKGGDWKENEIIGAEFVKASGGRVEIIPYLANYSTSSTIAFIQKNGSH